MKAEEREWTMLDRELNKCIKGERNFAMLQLLLTHGARLHPNKQTDTYLTDNTYIHYSIGFICRHLEKYVINEGSKEPYQIESLANLKECLRKLINNENDNSHAVGWSYSWFESGNPLLYDDDPVLKKYSSVIDFESLSAMDLALYLNIDLRELSVKHLLLERFEDDDIEKLNQLLKNGLPIDSLIHRALFIPKQTTYTIVKYCLENGADIHKEVSVPGLDKGDFYTWVEGKSIRSAKELILYLLFQAKKDIMLEEDEDWAHPDYSGNVKIPNYIDEVIYEAPFFAIGQDRYDILKKINDLMEAVEYLENISSRKGLNNSLNKEVMRDAKEIIKRREEDQVVLSLEQESVLTETQKQIKKDPKRKELIDRKRFDRMTHSEGLFAARKKLLPCCVKDKYENNNGNSNTSHSSSSHHPNHQLEMNNIVREGLQYVLREGLISQEVGVSLSRTNFELHKMVCFPKYMPYK